MTEKNKYFDRYLNDFVLMGGSYIPPSSSGKAVFDLSLGECHKMISCELVNKATDYADSFRLGFIKGDFLYYMPNSEEIRYREFLNYLKCSLGA